MQHFFLDLHECGSVTRDDEGIEREDVLAARADAVLAARDIMAAEVLAGAVCFACHIQVRDESGATVMIVPFGDTLAISGLSGDH